MNPECQQYLSMWKVTCMIQFDCPACGCQIIAQERKRNFIDISMSEKKGK